MAVVVRAMVMAVVSGLGREDFFFIYFISPQKIQSSI